MLPLFKSDFSIGKSILTLNLSKNNNKEGSDSIFEIAKANNLDEVILVEDNLSGFLQAHKNAQESDVQLIFGLRITICNDLKSDPKDSERKDESKVIIFAKNDEGCRELNRIYSIAFTEGFGRIDYKALKELWSDNLLLCIPFYDSFIFNNAMYFNNCIPDFRFCSPKFFIENNDLPFDSIIKERVIEFCDKKGLESESVKTIYYRERADLAAFQTYKCICSRNFSSGERGLPNPKLEHCSSAEFSFESWKEKQLS